MSIMYYQERWFVLETYDEVAKNPSLLAPSTDLLPIKLDDRHRYRVYGIENFAAY